VRFAGWLPRVRISQKNKLLLIADVVGACTRSLI